MQPLSAFIDTLRSARSEAVPYPDPRDGGAKAQVLLLLEAPGRSAVASGFVSLDNSDGTARNLSGILSETGLARSEIIVWNIIPGTSARTKRFARRLGRILRKALRT